MIQMLLPIGANTLYPSGSSDTPCSPLTLLVTKPIIRLNRSKTHPGIFLSLMKGLGRVLYPKAIERPSPCVQAEGRRLNGMGFCSIKGVGIYPA